MAETPHTSPRLDELRRRWQENPGSRVFLQLAEEYRQLNRTPEAAQILEQGLAQRPTDVAALVALGRCRLGLGNADAAVEVLERVLTIDPAHLVANKHLVDAHLDRGDAERARDRLSFYRLLNDRDPEIDHFAYRLSKLDGGEAPAPSASSETASADETSADLFELDDAPLVSDPGGVFSASAGQSKGNGDGDSRYQPPDEPFGALPPFESIAGHAEVNDGPFDLVSLFRLGAAPTPARGDETNALLEVDEPVAEEAVPTEAVSTGPAPTEAVPTEAVPTEAAHADAPATASEDDDLSGEVPATVALAAIYEEQGYRQEAAGVLERVLEAHPDNDEARSRLAELTETEPKAEAMPEAVVEGEHAEVTAARLAEEPETPPDDELDDAPTQPIEPLGHEASEPPEASHAFAETIAAVAQPDLSEQGSEEPLEDETPLGVTARKIHLLEQYLDTIRTARDRSKGDHVH